MEAYLHVPGFLTDDELGRLRDVAARCDASFVAVDGKGGLGPRYRVLDGDQIRAQAPEVVAFGAERIQPVAERFAGRPLQYLDFSKRAIRFQAYEREGDGFRWHFDGHSYVALVTLHNSNQGETHFISIGLSRILRFLLYPLYAFPQLFSLAPYRRVRPAPGDLLVMRGGKSLHRGVTRSKEGQRLAVLYTFDERGKKPSALRDFIARQLNY
jgi:hypothetical protein